MRGTTDDGGEVAAYFFRILPRPIHIALAALTVVAVALVPAAAGAQPRSHPPKHKFGRGTSTNWSGYDVTGSGATHVIGTWIQPTATCAAGESSWSSPWVGIDGDTSNTVEQIGTDTDCSSGSAFYYAWYEMYPKKLFTISMPVRRGDSFTGEVTSTSSTTFILRLTNNTTGTSFQTTQTTRKARRSSVEWIMEGPSSGLLTNFGSVGFTSASATINGQTASLNSLSNPQPITMVTQSGTPRAVPSSPIGSGGSFSVGWQHS
jgi:hypothetical protein